MDSSGTLTPTTSSTATSSSDASSDPSQTYRLEICLISAQDLPQVSKSMRTYAVAWIHPKRKLTSCIDQKGHNNPTWNDRFIFYVYDEFLIRSDHGALTIEIYNTSSWFKDALVGTVRMLLSDVITTSAMNNPRFVALHIRRPSGKFQGKLNMGVALVNDSKESRVPHFQINPTVGNLDMLSKNGYIFGENQPLNHGKLHFWHSQSLGDDEEIKEFPEKRDSVRSGSINNGSMCNGSELCSDVGPSASIVAAEIARQSLPPQPVVKRVQWRRTKEVEDIGSSIVEEMTMEEATAKGLTSNVTRLKKEVPFPPMHEGDKSRRVHMRRHSDGGLFSCFANAYGFEFTIVCGASNKPNFKESVRTQKKRPSSSEANSD